MLACLESLIGIGLFVSGVFLLGIASYLLSQEIITSTQLAITAAGGAMLGDHVGFFFGRFLGPRLHHTRLFIRHADRILKTEGMIARWGGIAVPIGRFVPAIRSIVPALLGTSGFASSSSTHCHAQHGRERWCCWQPESIRSFSPSFWPGNQPDRQAGIKKPNDEAVIRLFYAALNGE